MKKHILILFFVGLLFGCETEHDKAFNFIVSTPYDSINTKTGVFIKEFPEGPKTFNIKLAKIEMDKIEKLYISNHLDTLPAVYKSTCNCWSIPPMDERYIIYYRGEKKTFVYDYYEYADLDSTKVHANIKSFSDSVMKIIYENKDIKNIKSPHMHLM